MIKTRRDAEKLLAEWGFLPFFRNRIEGFSIAEHIDPALWFTDAEGPWEWKGPIIKSTGCAYGKFAGGKAVYVSKERFYDFANLRRDGYDLDSRYEEGILPAKDYAVYSALKPPMLSKDLKAACGIKGFDTVINRLQAQCYVLISDFVYMRDKNGNKYGWGVAEYSTPEAVYGDGFAEKAYSRTPEESFERLFAHLRSVLPRADEKDIIRFLGGKPNA